MRLFLPKKQPKQDRSQKTVDAILIAVIKLVEQGEPQTLTTTKIADKAGISVGSLYQYFPSKESVFSALLDFHFRTELELIRKALNQEKSTNDLRGSIARLVSEIVSIRRKSLRIERALFHFFSRIGNLDSIRETDEKMVAQIDEVLKEAASRGLVRRTDSTAFLLLHTTRSALVALTIQKPDAYRNWEDLEASLQRIILALLVPETD